MKSQPARLVACSDNSDLAMLKIDSATKNYFSLGDSGALRCGEEVHTVGNGNGYGLAYSGGNVAAPLRNVMYDGELIRAIQLSLVINEGNSGGPLVNARGELVGITTFRLRDSRGEVIYGTGFALPTTTILNFLKTV